MEGLPGMAATLMRRAGMRTRSSRVQLMLPPQPPKKAARSCSLWPARSPSSWRAWRWMCGFGSRDLAIRRSVITTKESRDEQAGHPQDGHSGMDGAAPRQAADRGTDRRLCRQDAAAPRASAQPPRPLSGDDGMAAAADRTAVTAVWRAMLPAHRFFVILPVTAISGVKPG